MPENQYFSTFGRPDVFITHFTDRGYLQFVKIKEGINMNALAERFIGSVRREALDYYLLISEKQIM